MAFCSNCGAQLTPGAKFCTSCGKPLPASADPIPEPIVPPQPPVSPEPAVPAPEPASVPEPAPLYQEVPTANESVNAPQWNQAPANEPANNPQWGAPNSPYQPNPNWNAQQDVQNNPYSAPQYGSYPPPGGSNAQPPKKGGKKTGLIVGIVIAALLVVGLIIGAILFFVNKDNGPALNVPEGVYTIKTVSVQGMEMDAALILGDSFAIELQKDGTAIIYAMEEMSDPGTWTLDDEGGITVDCMGDPISGTLENGVLMLADEASGLSITLEKTAYATYEDLLNDESRPQVTSPLFSTATIAPVSTPQPTLAPITVLPDETEAPVIDLPEETAAPAIEDFDTLPIPSEWHGTLDISNYSSYDGANNFEEGTIEVWATLDYSEDGRPFFEIYSEPYAGDADTIILSMWVEMDEYGPYFYPIIGENDAWFFDKWLTADDQGSFMGMLFDGQMTFYYFYATETDSFLAEIILEMDSTTY